MCEEDGRSDGDGEREIGVDGRGRLLVDVVVDVGKDDVGR